MASFVVLALFILKLSLLILYPSDAWGGGIDPTEGFISLPLNQSNFVIERPYDVPEDQRYSCINGVHKLWVYSTDKPHSLISHTNPRTKIRMQGYDYSSGVWQFEAYGYVRSGTSGVCIMQVFGSTTPHATTLMLRVYNGRLSYYKSPPLVDDIYDRWFRLNVIHDVDDAEIVKVYINGVLKFEAPRHQAFSEFLVKPLGRSLSYYGEF